MWWLIPAVAVYLIIVTLWWLKVEKDLRRKGQ